MRKILLCLFGLSFLSSACLAADTPYSNAVKALTPTYYYELNETDPDGGVIDSMGNAAPGEFKGEYGLVEDGFAQAGCAGPLYTNQGQIGDGVFDYFEEAVPGVGGEGNVAHCSNNVGHIDLGPSADFGANAMTVSMFFRHIDQESEPTPFGDRLFTNSLTDPDTSFQINVAGQGLVVAVNPGAAGLVAERTVGTFDGLFDNSVRDETYGWFHLVASTSGVGEERAENIQVWINGEDRTRDLLTPETGWGTDTNTAKIGGRRDDPADSTTHGGGQDEVAIWLDQVLSEDEVASLWDAAREEFTPVVCAPNLGDIDGNGTVEFADFLVLSSNFGSEGGPSDGDADCSGDVAFADFLILSQNFGQSVGRAEAVPEPQSATLLLVAVMGVTLLRRRRG